MQVQVEVTPLLTTAQVADWLNVSRDLVERLATRGEIPAVRVGARGDLRFEREAIERYLGERKVRA